MTPGKSFPGGAGKFPMAPKFPEMLPLPFVHAGGYEGYEDIDEYVAVVATPNRAPLGAVMSSVPARVPVGLAPSAVNTPEKIVWLREPVAIVAPTYLPLTELLESGPNACGSPNPDVAAVPPALSGAIRKAWLLSTR